MAALRPRAHPDRKADDQRGDPGEPDRAAEAYVEQIPRRLAEQFEATRAGVVESGGETVLRPVGRSRSSRRSGLDAALSGLAERCPVPVHVDIQVDARPPTAIETAAYYVVAEAGSPRC
jgi:hypothetical protein